MFFVRSLLSLDILTPEGFHSLEDAGFPGNSSLELARETQHWVIRSLPLAIPSMYKECAKVQPHLRRSASQPAPGPASWCLSPSEVFPSHLGSADLSKQWDYHSSMASESPSSHILHCQLLGQSLCVLKQSCRKDCGQQSRSEPPWKWYCNCCLPNFIDCWSPRWQLRWSLVGDSGVRLPAESLWNVYVPETVWSNGCLLLF